MIEGLFPEQASRYAPRVDALYLFLCAVALFFSGLITVLIVFFAIRFRRASMRRRRVHVHGNIWLEASWVAIPLVLTMVLFVWGARLYFESAMPPKDALDVYVVGKQWMWKVQHLQGRREINELHVPVDQPVRLTMASEDVIHSFFIPAFRVKMDVVPGRYSSLWFEAEKVGSYHLFCAEYCGTKHSQMIGHVIVMEPTAYQNWLAGRTGESMVATGKRLFENLGCAPCHQAEATRRGPSLEGTFGKPVRLASGQSAIVDEVYLRESILEPNAKIVAGYDAVMPTFEGQLGEEQLLQLIAYIKSLTKRDGAPE